MRNSTDLSRAELLESGFLRIDASDYARMHMEHARTNGGAVGSWNFYAKPVPANILDAGWHVWLMPEVNEDHEGIDWSVSPVFLTDAEVRWRLAEAVRADEVLTWDAEAVLA